MRHLPRHLLNVIVSITVCANASTATATSENGEPRLEIELKTAESVSTTCYPPLVAVVFKNTSGRPIVIIEPQDGSYHGWLPPHYDFAVSNVETKASVEPGGRCGEFGGKYTEETMHILGPGKTKELILDPRFIPAPGVYEFRLTYRVPELTYPGTNHSGVVGGLARTGKQWPRDVFTGEVQSNAIEIRVWPVDKAQAPRFANVLTSNVATKNEKFRMLGVIRRLGPDGAQAVSALVKLLGDADEKMRHKITGVIGDVGPGAYEAVPALIGLLPREYAISPLGLIGPKAETSVPHLVEILFGKHVWSRQSAAVALGQIHRRPDVTVPALLRYLDLCNSRRDGFGQDERRFAIRSLGQFGPDAKGALPAIEQYVDSTGSGFQYSVDDPKNDLGDVAKEAIRCITQEPSPAPPRNDAQQSAVPLPSAPAGPSKGAR